jgi:hypothetical protein
METLVQKGHSLMFSLTSLCYEKRDAWHIEDGW